MHGSRNELERRERQPVNRRLGEAKAHVEVDSVAAVRHEGHAVSRVATSPFGLPRS